MLQTFFVGCDEICQWVQWIVAEFIFEIFDDLILKIENVVIGDQVVPCQKHWQPNCAIQSTHIFVHTWYNLDWFHLGFRTMFNVYLIQAYVLCRIFMLTNSLTSSSPSFYSSCTLTKDSGDLVHMVRFPVL